jgi:hypothetical protein
MQIYIAYVYLLMCSKDLTNIKFYFLFSFPLKIQIIPTHV